MFISWNSYIIAAVTILLITNSNVKKKPLVRYDAIRAKIVFRQSAKMNIFIQGVYAETTFSNQLQVVSIQFKARKYLILKKMRRKFDCGNQQNGFSNNNQGENASLW
jgi:hypothetical protein